MFTWSSRQIEHKTLHEMSVSETSENAVRESIEACVGKAIQLLAHNIQDDSLYLLFEWNPHTAELNVVVTDASKTRDAPESVSCRFSSLAVELARENDMQRKAYIESIKFWLHDYLSTSTTFLGYSLVAIFHTDSRANSELL